MSRFVKFLKVVEQKYTAKGPLVGLQQRFTKYSGFGLTMKSNRAFTMCPTEGAFAVYKYQFLPLLVERYDNFRQKLISNR